MPPAGAADIGPVLIEPTGMSSQRDPTVGDALRDIEAAPTRPATAAFFDLDAILEGCDEDGASTPARLEQWAGKPPDELAEHAAKRFRKGDAAGLRYEAWDLVKAHQRRSHTVVLVASVTRPEALPVAEELGIEHLLCSEAELSDGRLTGRLRSSTASAAEKREAMEAFAAEGGIDLRASFAYAAGHDDIPVLEAVANPTALGPDDRLRDQAATRGWPCIDTFYRAAGPLGVARTVASYGAFLASTGVGVVAGLRARRRRAGVDAMTRMFARIGPPLSGIGIAVQGEEHLHSHRPAVFLVNHQSSLVDAIVTYRLLHDGFTPVAKREVRNIPAIGQATWLADWAYVDRVGDKKAAREAVQDAVDKLKAGVSMILAPEGTRSVGPKPGPFKKGGFFMAREAEVPVIPIVMRNSGELMWRNGRALKPGTVDVVVHPPIFCDWEDEDFDDRVAEVRQRFVDTLEDWPRPAA